MKANIKEMELMEATDKEQLKLIKDDTKERMKWGEKKKLHKTGTKEWSKHSLNIFKGCEHNCRYCYAQEMAKRFKRIKSADEWKDMVLSKAFDKKCIKRNGVHMFPSTHDIIPENVDKCIEYLERQLSIGNHILIVSKPHFECITKICYKFLKYKDQMEFRFTIGSTDNAILKFWEPNAPTFEERLKSLEYTFLCGYRTSVSCEPVLEKNIVNVVDAVIPYVNGTIWLGQMNGIKRRVNISKFAKEEMVYLQKAVDCTKEEFILDLYEKMKNNPKIRWKESYKKVLGLPEQEEVE